MIVVHKNLILLCGQQLMVMRNMQCEYHFNADSQAMKMRRVAIHCWHIDGCIGARSTRLRV
jgi:hypothetical protein